MFNKKPYLKHLERLRAGIYRDSRSGLFLDRNERCIPFSNELIESLSKKLKDVPLSLYPELGQFYKKLSVWLSFPEDQIYLTEGVSGAIKSLIETLTLPGKHNIIFPFPTFALYPVYCKMFDVEAKMVSYTKGYDLEFSRLIQLIDDSTAIVFLPNPNMPIEGTVSINELEVLAEQCSKYEAILAIDEVYYPYDGPTAIELISKYDNIFVMRSFSKAFGLAGIRLGYLLGSAENIDYVSKTRTGYETNSVSMEIAMFFIDNYQIILDYVGKVKNGLEYLKIMLTELGIESNGGTSGNFLFVNLYDASLVAKIVGQLIEKRIYIRHGWPSPYDTGFTVSGAPISIMEGFYHEFSRAYLYHTL